MIRLETGSGWTMVHADAFDVVTVWQDKCVDVCLMDPPYEAEAHTKARRSLKDATQRRGARNTGAVRRIDEALEIDFAAITEDQRDNICDAVVDVTRRWVLAFCQIEAVAKWRSSMTSAGLDWVRGGVWRKPDGAPQFTGDRPGQGFECVAIAHPSGRKRWNGGGSHAFWSHPLEHSHGAGGKAEHPTIKPLSLMLELVELFTDAGETVLDPFAGSGTTGVACVRLGREFVGIERDPRYFALACERLRAEERGSTVVAARAGQTTIFDRVGT